MALQKQKVSIPLLNGIDTKIDDKQEEIGAISLLENAILDTPKKARKRNGYRILPNVDINNKLINNIETITSFNNELCVYNDKNFYSFSESNQKWVEKGITKDVFPRSFPIIKNTFTQSNYDANFISGICVAAWEDSRGGVRLSIVDTVTDNYLLSDYLINSNATNPRVCNIFNFTYIVYNDGIDIKYVRINTLQPTQVDPEQTLASNFNTVLNVLDAIPIGNRVYVAYATDSGEGEGDLSVFYLREDGSISSTIIEAGEAPTNALCMYADPQSRVVIVYATQNDIRAVVYSLSLGIKIVNPIILESVADVGSAAVILYKNKYHVYYEIVSDVSANNFIRRTTFDLSSNLGIPEFFKRSLCLASKLFLYNGDLFVPCLHDSNLQSTYFILDQNADIIGKVSPGQAGTRNSSRVLPKLAKVDDDTFQFVSQIKSFLLGQSENTFFSSLGLNRTLLEFKINNKNQNATLVKNLHTSGGILKVYDGNEVVEHGFHLFPENLKLLNQTAGAGLLRSTDNASTFTSLTTVNGLNENTINKLFIDSSNRIYALTDEALNISNTPPITTFTPRTEANGLGSLDIRGVESNGAAKIFVATSNGVSISLDTGATFVNYVAGDGKKIIKRNQISRIAAKNLSTRRVPRGEVGFGASPQQVNLFKEYQRQLKNEIALQTFLNAGTGLTSSNIKSSYYHAPSNSLYLIHSTGYDVTNNDGVTFNKRSKTNGLGSDTVNKILRIGTTVYVATTGGFSISTDSGATFTNKTTANGLGSNTVLDFIVNGSTIYAGTTLGFSISTDGGNTWVNRDLNDGLDSTFISEIYRDSTGVIYVLTEFGLNRSTDGGATFVPRSSEQGLGKPDINNINLTASNILYVTGTYGLLRSTDNGATFTTLSTVKALNSQNVNFLISDSLNRIYIAAGSGSLAQGTYQYSAVYRWIDNKGQEHLSAPSIGFPVQISAAGTVSSAEIEIPTLRLTNKKVVSIEIYRTEVNGTVFYKESSIEAPLSNDVNIDSVTYVSSLPDSELIKKEVLYTSGGELENIAAPASRIIEAWNNRIFLAGLENENLLQYSKVAFPGTPVQFNDALTILLPDAGGPITALKSMDDKLIIFKEDAIYYLSGDGPNNLGEQNTFINPELISSDIGCQNPDSLVFMPQGVMFKSDKGIYLLSRGLQLNYIGVQVEAYNPLIVSSAEIIQDKNQIRFLTNNECLVYNYELGKWSVFTNHRGVSATTLLNDYYYIRPDSTIYKESLDSFTDAGSPIKLRVVTSWMSFADVQGFQRVYSLYVLGQFYSAHKLLVKVAYNFVDVFIQEKLVDVSQFASDSTYGEDSPYGEPETTPYGGKGNRYQVRIQLKKQKCQSIKISVEDVQSDTLGEALDLSNLALIVGIKSGLFKPEAGRSFGTK